MTAAATPIFEEVPADLRELERWVCWRFEERDGKQTKVPINARTGERASSTDPQTWTDLITAQSRYEAGGVDGVGITLGDGLAGVDLDGHRDPETGTLDPLAMGTVVLLGSYSEQSPSGRGVHVLLRGSKPPGSGSRRDDLGIEIYTEGRYFTVTGRRLIGVPLMEDPPATVEKRQDQFADLCRRLWPGAASAASGNGASATESTAPEVWSAKQRENWRERVPDSEVRRLLFGERKDGEKWRRVYEDGDTSYYDGDDSRADLGLMGRLRFYAGKDPERLERLFGESALGKREKWTSRPEYRQMTINKALPGEVYSGKRPEADPQPVIEGPGGIRFEIESARQEARWTSVQMRVVTDNERLPFTFNDSPTSVNNTAREIAGRDRDLATAVRRSLRAVISSAMDWIQERDKNPAQRKNPREVMLAEAARLRLAFMDERDRAWSESLGKPLYQRQFVERMIFSEVIDQLQQTDEFFDCRRTAVISGAKKLAEEIWSTVVRDLREQDQAENLGPDSKAAAEVRRTIEEIWHRPIQGMSASLLSLATRGSQTNWFQVLPGSDSSMALMAWCRFREGGYQLAMTFPLLAQFQVRIPGIRDDESFRAVLERYGILEPVDRQDDRARADGKRIRVYRISKDLAAEWLSAFRVSRGPVPGSDDPNDD